MLDLYMDAAVLGTGIIFFFTVRKYIGYLLKRLLGLAVILVLVVTLYGAASNLSRISLEKAEAQTIEFFQEVMGND